MNIIADEIKLNKDVLALSVVNELKKHIYDERVNLYYMFPIYRGDLPEDIVQAQLLITSPIFGVIYIKCQDSSTYLNEEECEYMENLDSNIYKKFISRSELRKDRRMLKFDITGLIVGSISENKDEFRYIKIDELCEIINEFGKDDILSENEYNLLVSCIDNTTKMSIKKIRNIERKSTIKTKGELLGILQNRDSFFDSMQRKIAMSCIDSPQRIRGLAGSGKTILLTMKAAIYHLSNPNEDILYTYYTKDLHELIKNLIERFYREASDNHEPNWSKIHILHAWGGSELPGVYSTTCSRLNITPINFQEARKNAIKRPFDYVCDNLLRYDINPIYGLTLIDEGQDFHYEFFRLCYRLTKNRRIVWAYDDFQNIFDVHLQDEKETFGKDSDGNYYVDFSRNENANQDMVLKCCYRTPRNILTAAFALGLGIYNDKVLQRLPSNNLWESLGFTVEKGNCNDGDDMIISRPIENTPSIINEYHNISNIIINSYNKYDNECEAVVNSIHNDITHENLRADDICVICLDTRAIDSYYGQISFGLHSKGIKTFNMLNAPNSNTVFSKDDCVTLATLNKAKGNEKGMVYIVGTDTVFTNSDNVIARNRLFTAMTRAKGWVMITGVGDIFKNKCGAEIKALVDNDFKLCFKQPSIEQTKTIMDGSKKEEVDIDDLVLKIREMQSKGYNVEDLIKRLGL